MLEKLLSINPALYNQLIKKLVDWCQLIEHRHNAVSGSYGFRKIRPDDSGMSGERIFSESRFCLGCGCPVNYDNEKENLYKELNVENGKKNL